VPAAFSSFNLLKKQFARSNDVNACVDCLGGVLIVAVHTNQISLLNQIWAAVNLLLLLVKHEVHLCLIWLIKCKRAPPLLTEYVASTIFKLLRSQNLLVLRFSLYFNVGVTNACMPYCLMYSCVLLVLCCTCNIF
jgi:hypothetical protein